MTTGGCVVLTIAQVRPHSVEFLHELSFYRCLRLKCYIFPVLVHSLEYQMNRKYRINESLSYPQHQHIRQVDDNK